MNNSDSTSDMAVKYRATRAGNMPQATLAPKVTADTDRSLRVLANLSIVLGVRVVCALANEETGGRLTIAPTKKEYEETGSCGERCPNDGYATERSPLLQRTDSTRR